MFNARKGLPGHLYYGIVRKALEMMDFKNTVQDGDEARSKIMYSSDLAALLDFMPDDIDKVSWKGGKVVKKNDSANHFLSLPLP